MRLGVFLSYSTAPAVAREAERLGYAMALAPEGFKSDAMSVLGAVAASTGTIGLGTGVAQLAARTPVMAALTAATLDALSGGRFHLGLGVSNAAVSEGWYGVPFAEPLQRVREYVEIVRLALSREPVVYAGRHFRLPGAAGAMPARLDTPGARQDIPIFLAAVGDASLRLTGEIADGWIGVFASPARIAAAIEQIEAGRSRRPGGRGSRFEVLPSVPVGIADTVAEGADRVRDYFARYLGMGEATRNFYARLFTSLGYGDAVAAIHERHRAGDMRAAAAAVPVELMDEVSLIGPLQRVANRLGEYRKAGVTTLGATVLARGEGEQRATVRALADAWRRSGVGD
ncbi:MAG TPA: LLM class flavin-dependent oxidoreductase [Rugosimonospora sp.]|nr:LLM class flavin-dependent oxidoreductase [Rugosimonospora sp.]